MSRLRFCEYVPPPPEHDARLLRGLPPAWQQAVAESAVDALLRRGASLASRLELCGRLHEAGDLRRRLAALGWADELHLHSADVETIVHLCRALSHLAEPDLVLETARARLQTMPPVPGPLSGHGSAFRETAALRNRAFRWVEAAIAGFARTR